MAGLAALPRTKIVVTIGPASRDAATIQRLLEAGASVFRLNFSHGTHEDHEEALSLIRAASERLGRPAAVLQDLCGPKFRVGRVPEGGIPCRDGEVLVIQGEPTLASPGRISITYDRLARDVKVGDRIFIDDGNIRLVVESISGGEVTCRVSSGGLITSGRGVNLPGVAVSAPSVTEKDLADLEWGLAHGVDYVALSFVRSVEDVRRIQRAIHTRKAARGPRTGGSARATPAGGADVHVIAKIEKPEALDHIDAIVDVADGLMVARGDLGVEMPLERVPLIQKDLIERCHARHKPVIVATQMLQSMTDAAAPTRAEVSDVANAVFDGADALMLSGETAVGRYPVNACLTMAQVARTTEAFLAEPARGPRSGGRGQLHRPDVQSEEYPTADAVCHGAARIAEDLRAGLVVVSTRSGTTALLLSKQRLRAPVLALSDNPRTVNRMCLYWGVVPLFCETVHDQERLLTRAEEAGLAQRLVGRGQALVLVGGTRLGRMGATDMLRVHHVRGRPDEAGLPAAEGKARKRTKRDLTTVETAAGVHTVDHDLCIQCGVCVQQCPVDVYRWREGRIHIEAEAAARCLFDYICRDCCPVHAIGIRRARAGPGRGRARKGPAARG